MTQPHRSSARRAALVLPLGTALLLLGACSLFRPSAREIPADQDTPDHRACRAEAQQGPDMQALNRQRNIANEFNTERMAREERVVFNRAYRDCLRARGLALPGGVEPHIPR
jgi:hypothetical protein